MLQFYFLIFFGGSFDVTSMKTTKTNDETIGLSLNPKQGSARLEYKQIFIIMKYAIVNTK